VGIFFPEIAVLNSARARTRTYSCSFPEKEIDSLALSTRSQFRFEKLPTIGFPVRLFS